VTRSDAVFSFRPLVMAMDSIPSGPQNTREKKYERKWGLQDFESLN